MGGACSTYEWRTEYKMLARKHQRLALWEMYSVDGMMMLKWMSDKYGVWVWIRFIWHRRAPSGELL
jgi:hypothetical protein